MKHENVCELEKWDNPRDYMIIEAENKREALKQVFATSCLLK